MTEEKQLIQVDPVDTKEVDGEYYEYRYTYEAVISGDIDREIDPPNYVSVEFDDKGMVWQYKDRCPVFVRGHRAYVPEGCSKEEAQNQVYFCLSFLADRGYVSGWRKA